MAKRRRSPARAAMRFVASVMIVSGVLMLADAVLTLTWQEPVSSFFAARQQDSLENALASPPRRVVRRRPLPGDALGRIRIPSIGVSKYVVEGTGTKDLRKGPGHYRDTPLPGERGTVGIAGHRTTYGAPFRKIDKLRRGDEIIVEMAYGRYVYRVEATRIVEPTEVSVKRRRSFDRLILSACHPLYSAAQRIVVFAKEVRRERANLTRG